MPGLRFGSYLLCCIAAVTLGSCDLAYPEVVVVNKTTENIIIKNISFNGCVWDTVLEYGDWTTPGDCLPGYDHLHFQKLDTETNEQNRSEESSEDNEEPTWFNYQTISVKHVDYGDFCIFEITLDDMEQDFSAPNPNGH